MIKTTNFIQCSIFSYMFEVTTGLLGRGPGFTIKVNVSASPLAAIFSGIRVYQMCIRDRCVCVRRLCFALNPPSLWVNTPRLTFMLTIAIRETLAPLCSTPFPQLPNAYWFIRFTTRLYFFLHQQFYAPLSKPFSYCFLYLYKERNKAAVYQYQL